VVLATASWLYRRSEKTDITERENQRTATRLDAEIASRLVYLGARFEMRWTKESDEGNSQLVIELERPSDKDYPVNVFPEYSNRSFRSLLWELIQALPEREREDIRRAYQKSLQLQFAYLKAIYYENGYLPGHTLSSGFRAVADSTNALLEVCSVCNLQRWGKPFEDLLRVVADDRKAVIQPPKPQ
jgi:hypothetical protein